MAAFNKYTAGVESLLESINAGTDTWKVALATTINPAETSFVAGTTDNPTAFGYTAGGNVASVVSSSQTGGVYKLVLSSPVAWTANGSGFSVRYAILYDYTTLSPIGYWDYGSVVNLNGANGDTFTVNLDGANGVFQVS